MTWLLENPDALATALVQHLVLVGLSLAISLAVALPLGILSARRPILYAAVLVATDAVYTIPTLALFALLVPLLGLGTVPAVTAIVTYSLVILVRNTAVGLREVPADILDAADGMGFGRAARLWRIELPLAAPLVIAGIRLAVVTQVSVATVAAFIGAGGLGDLVFQGITQDIGEKVVVGAVAASALAVLADEALRQVERRVRIAAGAERA